MAEFPGSPSPHRVFFRMGKKHFQGWFADRWLGAWVAFVVVLFAVPTLLMVVAQRHWLALEQEAWQSTLDPLRPDPGLLPAEPLPTV